ncbi:hypothetical protein Plim_4298 (plasmid) [Planctopirus limnophila DSM 3776]|uniref:Uncharacterized protein n=1 Tax=Planctopirus limnophila (strain ATCC 43296 / DSM 3776 / IFAM 1008 / Mu 290) TaxID=521674 RepID=D5SZI5_PLAL2|nr:hypothetical protein [Planctopirus limnophila]ADG70105.1 hypothetical protein Plim_4298 [Planctopirus limnophila DSM 3776]
MANLTAAHVDLDQGTNDDDRKFGYVFGDEGGFFFTHMPTLQETLDSIEVDEVDGDGGLTSEEVVEFLRTYLPGKIRFRGEESDE